MSVKQTPGTCGGRPCARLDSESVYSRRPFRTRAGHRLVAPTRRFLQVFAPATKRCAPDYRGCGIVVALRPEGQSAVLRASRHTGAMGGRCREWSINDLPPTGERCISGCRDTQCNDRGRTRPVAGRGPGSFRSFLNFYTAVPAVNFLSLLILMSGHPPAHVFA